MFNESRKGENMTDTLDSRDLEEQLKDSETDDETKKAIKEIKRRMRKLWLGTWYSIL